MAALHDRTVTVLKAAGVKFIEQTAGIRRSAPSASMRILLPLLGLLVAGLTACGGIVLMLQKTGLPFTSGAVLAHTLVPCLTCAAECHDEPDSHAHAWQALYRNTLLPTLL